MSRIVIIGCGKSKAAEPCAARQLYTGNLFAARRAYAEASGDPWFIASAKHGLVKPDDRLAPYDLTISELAPIDRHAWALATALALLSELEDDAELREVNVELHMGADYAELLKDALLAAGLSFSWPVESLGLGEQLAWYKDKTPGERLSRSMRESKRAPKRSGKFWDRNTDPEEIRAAELAAGWDREP